MKKTLILMAMGMAIFAARAQYRITLNDNSVVEVAESSLTFAGSDDDAAMVVGERSYRLADVTSIEPTGAYIEPIVLAYHTYYSSYLPKPETITHLNYGFAEVYVSEDGVYNGFKLQGTTNAFKRAVKIKEQNPAIKICLSFTHTVVNSDNAQGGGFSAIAASEEYRKKFAEDCLAFIEQYGIDGIDLDWEFPGISWSGAACDPVNDVANYTLLVKQLRETLGNDYLVTFAGYCMDKKTTSSGSRYIDLAAVEPYVDFVNVMTYDFDEAPHYQNAVKSSVSYWDIERTIAAYRKAGFPLDKVVLGLAFYVRNTFSNSVAYKDLAKLAKDERYVIDNWSDVAQVPYVTCDGKMWGSYDNPRSIDLKGAYAASLGLRGLFYWCTYEDDAYRTLGQATWESRLNNFK